MDITSEAKRLNVCCFKNRSCLNTRQQDYYTKRRYQCKVCGMRWTSVEIVLGNIRFGKDVIQELETLIAGISKERHNATLKLIELLARGE